MTHNTREVIEEKQKVLTSTACCRACYRQRKQLTDEIIKELEHTHHQELQKAREQRKGWKGYLVVDPETDNYTYSDVYLNRIDAEKWLKANGISGLKIIEVDVYQSELDQPTIS